MFFLITGQPGNGKTLWTVSTVEAVRVKEKREVFYHGIPDVTLPWSKLPDPKRWFDCPPGSIIVIDECQDIFRSRKQGDSVPDYYEQVTRHRHAGFDLYFITQDAMNIDAFVRRLANRHVHLKRAFGVARSRVYQWQGLGNPTDYHSKKEALKTWFKFPRKSFGWYKSAEVHTHKRDLPVWKFAGLGALGLVVAFLFWRVYDRFAGDEEAVAGEGVVLEAGIPAFSAARWSSEALTPVVEGIPESAPIYASAVKITQAPKIAGCGSIKVGHQLQCFCHSQQGTRVPMSLRLCMEYVKQGVFDADRQDDYYPKIPPYVPPLPGQEGGSAEEKKEAVSSIPPPAPKSFDPF